MLNAQEVYVGTVSKFIYRAPEFAIFKFKSQKNDFIALGNITEEVNEGEKLHLKGLWVDHPKYGKQLKIESWEKIVPTGEDEAVELLSSGIIKGVGPATARKIVKALGPDAIRKILENPDELKSVKGIKKKAPEIARSVMETYDAQRVVKELVSFGISPGTARKVYKFFGRQAAEYVRLNPYCLTKVEQVGFLKADEIAQNIGVKPNSRFRVEAGVLFVLNEALWNEGHVYLPVPEIVSRSMALLNKEYDDVTRDQVLESLSHKEIAVHEKGVSLSWALNCEREAAANIKRLNKRLSEINPEPVLSCYEAREKIRLSDKQRQAVAMVINSGLSILTGGPGVGKTAAIKAIILVFEKIYQGKSVALAAPTGRAARKMAEVTGRHASTIHKLLGITQSGKPAFNRQNPLSYDLLIVDEFSMADVVMAKNIFNAVKDGARVLLVGDPDQLPSVGPGNVLRDMLSVPGIPRVSLDKIFRQAAESQIVTSAHRINKGLPLIIDRSKTDLLFFEREEPGEIAKSVVSYVRDSGLSDVQVLAPMKKGPVGTQELNRLIREAVNPGSRETLGFRVGDKVIQTRNNYSLQVFNGDIGTVESAGDAVSVRFNGDVVEYSHSDVKDLELAYAISIHKSQGSEFKAVVIPLTTSHYMMLARSLLYTAVTRAREKVVLIGSKKALAMAIKNNKPVQRYTMLKSFIENS